ncbi:MAG: twin arginine-targeting protein translocase TatC [Candidatus Aminicenantes bacterium RBG_13_62_12]|jgi:sec-independent protein translocase protein TatC|nr:MAG: twin arginine-targeting protein translocase TatC [Candidatus Aminicenantes bacterium RBG_13_62_12]
MGKAKKSPDEMTFLEHLEDLRKRLWYSFVAIFVVVIPAWMFSRDIFKALSLPVTQFLPEGMKMAFTSLTAPFMLYIKVAFLTALFVTSPFIFLQLWYFIAPGLYQKEKKYVVPFVTFTTVFFLAGAAFGYFVMFPWACRFFLKLGSEFTPVLTVDTYFSFSLKLLLGIALVFELPTLVFFLSKIGLITSRWMVRNFKYAVLAIFVIAAVITPTPDMVTQSILAVPMLALYGLGILIAFFFGKERKTRREKKAEEEIAG